MNDLTREGGRRGRRGRGSEGEEGGWTGRRGRAGGSRRREGREGMRGLDYIPIRKFAVVAMLSALLFRKRLCKELGEKDATALT